MTGGAVVVPGSWRSRAFPCPKERPTASLLCAQPLVRTINFAREFGVVKVHNFTFKSVALMVGIVCASTTALSGSASAATQFPSGNGDGIRVDWSGQWVDTHRLEDITLQLCDATPADKNQATAVLQAYVDGNIRVAPLCSGCRSATRPVTSGGTSSSPTVRTAKAWHMRASRSTDLRPRRRAGSPGGSSTRSGVRDRHSARLNHGRRACVCEDWH